MSSFFLPPSPGCPADEQAYADLRELAESYTGSPSNDRRIEQVECRRRGRDCTLRVGEADATNGRTVAAIIQLGRDTYTVHHMPAEPGEPLEPTVLQRTEIYSVTEFR
ncbi:MAG: hypothetical protein ACLQBB_07215 [Solirubrobacteraceae bacterium]